MQPGLGLTADSRTTDFQPGLWVLVLIGLMTSRQGTHRSEKTENSKKKLPECQENSGNLILWEYSG